MSASEEKVFLFISHFPLHIETMAEFLLIETEKSASERPKGWFLFEFESTQYSSPGEMKSYSETSRRKDLFES